MSLLRNIFSVALSNIASYGTRILSTIMLPIVLTQADYGAYSKYLTLISLTYLFNFGYNDGIYIKYGGVDADAVDLDEVRSEHNFVLIFQILVFFLMLIYGVSQQNIIFVLFSVSTLFDTINTYHQNFLQATGQFSVYSKGNILRSIYTFLALLVVMFVFRADHYLAYVLLNVSTFLFIVLYYSHYFRKNVGFAKTWSLDGKDQLFKVGFFILIANASLTLAGNIGAMVGGANFSNEVFAHYGFQNSILNAILLVANAVGMVFYNLIAKKREEHLLNQLKQACVILGMMSGLFFFIAKFGIEEILPLLTTSDYRPAVSLLSITFIAIPYIMTSRMVISNIYKVAVPVREYVIDSLVYVIVTAILVFAAYYQFKSLSAIAAATSLSYFLWYLFCTQIKFPYLKNQFKAFVMIISHVLVFYICANLLPLVWGFLLYLIFVFALLVVFKKEIQAMAKIIKQ